jgi:hypothetical protein
VGTTETVCMRMGARVVSEGRLAPDSPLTFIVMNKEVRASVAFALIRKIQVG